MSPLPAHVARHIAIRDGAPITARHINAGTCKRCHAVIWGGLDNHVLAMFATVDPTPIDPTTELACILTSRHTYRLWGTGARRELTHRDMWALRTPPGPEVTVLPAHVCGQPLPTTGWPPDPSSTGFPTDPDAPPPF